MTVERLRAAATQLREWDRDATPAPWWPCGCDCGEIFAGPRAHQVNVAATYGQQDTALIAGMRQTLTRLADWLDREADLLIRYNATSSFAEALAVADAVLGGEASKTL